MKDLNLVNVIFYDGNRKVNWDFIGTKLMSEALGRFGFKWEKNSIRVNGHPIADAQLYHRLEAFVEASKRCGDYNNRLFVTMERPKSKEKS